jgi:hypothetical protein
METTTPSSLRSTAQIHDQAVPSDQSSHSELEETSKGMQNSEAKARVEEDDSLNGNTADCVDSEERPHGFALLDALSGNFQYVCSLPSSSWVIHGTT